MDKPIQTAYVDPKLLSEKNLQKAVLKKALGAGGFQYPIFAAIGLLGLGFLFGFSFWLIVTCILLAAFSSLSWVVQMFMKSDKIKLAYIKQLRELAEEEIQRKNYQLSRDLINIDLPDAAIQLEQFQSNFKNFVFILEQKFSTEELAYSRYYSIVQQIILSGMNNLQTIFLRKKNLMDANPGEVKRTLVTLLKIKDPTSPQQSRITELKRRLEIYDEETRDIDELLAQNEKALTAIDDVSRNIAKLNTDSNLSSDMESAMKDLIEMTDFTKVLDSNYSNAIKVK